MGRHHTTSSRNAAALICDAEYLPAALFVAGRLLKPDILKYDVVIIVSGEMPSLTGIRIDPRIRIMNVQPDQNLQQIPHSNRKSSATFVRLSLDKLLGHTYEKILYLDCDVWISRSDIADLFDIDMGRFAIAAVRDAAEIVWPNSPEWRSYRQRLGLSDAAHYFNSGVLLIDSCNYSAAKLGEQTTQYLLEGKFRGGFHDQSALNAVLNGDWLELSPMWNWMFAPRRELTKRYAPSIIHFIGPNKPWKDAKGKHAPEYRQAMDKDLRSIGISGYVAPVGLLRRIERAASYTFTKIVGNNRDKLIEDFMNAQAVAAAQRPRRLSSSISAPMRMIIADSQIHIMKPTTAPREP